MNENKQSGGKPANHDDNTKGFPIVTEQDESDAAMFEMKKKEKDGTWTAATPVHVSDHTPVSFSKEETVEETEPTVTQPEECAAAETAEPEESEESAVPAEDSDIKIAGTEQENKSADDNWAEVTRPIETPVYTDEMDTEKPKKKLTFGKKLAAGIAGVVVVAVAGFSIFVYTYSGIFPGVKVAEEYKLSGMTQQEAQNYIAGEVQNGVFGGTIQLNATDLNVADKDAAARGFEIAIGDVADSVDSAASAQQAYLIGREGNYFQRVGTVLNSMFSGWDVSMNAAIKDGAVQEKVTEIASQLAYAEVQPTWSVDKTAKELTVDTGKPGLGFDQDAVVNAITTQAQNINMEPYTIETYVVEQNKPDAAAIAADVNTKAQNATVDKTDGSTILDAVDGIAVEESTISSAIGDASEQTYTIPIELTLANVTKSDLEQVLFRDTLSSTTTYYSGTAARTNNVRLASNAVDETILNPGEEFSYNDTVGERTASRGYQGAIVFNNGKQVTELGGGVCQVSSTIYMAVLRADLEVTERSCHQFQVTYTPLSQDAAVYWGSKDFRFVNNTEYPVKVVTSMGGGSLTVSIIGTKTEDKEISFYSTSSYGSKYKYAALYKTVTVNGESTTTKENESSYLLS